MTPERNLYHWCTKFCSFMNYRQQFAVTGSADVYGLSSNLPTRRLDWK